MASLANLTTRLGKFHFAPGRFCTTGKMAGCDTDQGACSGQQWNRKNAPKSGTFGEAQKRDPVLVSCHIRNENRQLHARRTGADRSRRYGHFPKLIEKARRKFALRNDTQPFEFGVVQLGRSKSCVKMLTHPLRQMVLIAIWFGKPNSRSANPAVDPSMPLSCPSNDGSNVGLSRKVPWIRARQD